MTHSKLPPSSAARRMACPGSRAMSERFSRNEESEASKEGTLAHELAALYAWRPYTPNWERPDGYTDEMHNGAELYSEMLHSFVSNNCSVVIENKVSIDCVHPDMWGTPDAYISTINKGVHVFDYKFGFTPVEAYENWQLLAYACGIVDACHDVRNICLHIIQPRDHVSRSKHKVWNLSSEELEGYRQRLQVSEALAMSPNAPLRVSSECKYCPARHACPALREAAIDSTRVAFRDVPQGLSPSEIGLELKLLQDAHEMLEYRITALETEVFHLIQSGANVDGYELTPSVGRLTWTVDTKKVLEFGDCLGVDLRKEDILTPTQAIKAGVQEDIVLAYSERKQSLKLSKVDVSKAIEVFKKR